MCPLRARIKLWTRRTAPTRVLPLMEMDQRRDQNLPGREYGPESHLNVPGEYLKMLPVLQSVIILYSVCMWRLCCMLVVRYRW